MSADILRWDSVQINFVYERLSKVQRNFSIGLLKNGFLFYLVVYCYVYISRKIYIL